MTQNKTPTEATLLRWQREVMRGTAGMKVCQRLVDHYEDCALGTGFTPVALSHAYHLAFTLFPCLWSKVRKTTYCSRTDTYYNNERVKS